MKYQVGDRVKCSTGYGVVAEARESNKLVPLDLYNIKLDKPVVNQRYPKQGIIKSFWYAEHELQLERDVRYLDDYKNGPIKRRKKERELSL